MSQPSVVLILLLLLLVGAVFVAAFAVWLALRVARPLAKMSEAADAVAAGDLSPDLAARTGSAMVRRLGGALARMLEALRRLVGAIRAAAEEAAAMAAQISASTEQMSSTGQEMASTQGCPTLPAPWTRWTFWQHTDRGAVPGIDGAVDLDQFAGTLGELHAER